MLKIFLKYTCVVLLLLQIGGVFGNAILIEGGGDYRAYQDYEDLDYFDIDSQKDAEGFYLPTGEVTLSDIKEGRYYPVIADRNNLTKEISLSVLDANIILSEYIPPDFKVGQSYNIQVLDRYQRIVDIRQTKGQELLSTRYVVDTRDNQEYIQIKALKSGSTTLEAIDEEGNKATIKIQIGAGADDCPDGDYTGSDRDGKCGEAPQEEEHPDTPSANISDSEVDTLLRELFAEFGIESVESEGVEVNSEYKLTNSIKNKVDIIVKGWIETRGENKVLAIQKYIPNIKKKYNENRIDVLMDYLFDSIDKQISIKIIHSVENTSNGEIGGLEFQVKSNLQSKISNIGVQYIDGNGNKQKQELKIQSDGKYIVAFSQDSCRGCKDLKPYYLLSGRTDMFISSNESNIEVANSSYSQFVNLLKSIWNWRGYSKQESIRAIVDIKEDIVKSGKDISIYLILQSISKSARLNIGMNDFSIDTLPVAGYMLDKFLNDENPYMGHETIKVTDKNGELQDAIHYSGNHKFVSEFRKTVDYSNILKLIDSECNYHSYKDYKNLLDGEKSICIEKDGSNFNVKQELDLFMAVHGYNYSIEIFKQNKVHYSRIMFWDEYDFEPNTYGTSVSDTLNYWGNYYEKELNGNNYWWAVEIIDEL